MKGTAEDAVTAALARASWKYERSDFAGWRLRAEPQRLAKGTVPTSIRFSGMLLARVDEVAEAQGVTRTEAIERLLVHALMLGLVEKGASPLAELSDRRRPK